MTYILGATNICQVLASRGHERDKRSSSERAGKVDQQASGVQCVSEKVAENGRKDQARKVSLALRLAGG